MSTQRTKEEFIKLAVKKHGDKYNYSKVVYKNSKELVIIICKKHGEFLQKPVDHLQGRGCKRCGYEKSGEQQSLDFEDFVCRSNKIHNFKYEYLKTERIRSSVKVDIVCPIHGVFKMTPNSHLKGQECKKCSLIKRSKNARQSQKAFIQKAISVHGEKYDYSSSVYEGVDKGVDVLCPIHGVFKQKAGVHLRGRGCKRCAVEKNHSQDYLKRTKEEFFKKAKLKFGSLYDYSESDYRGCDFKIKIKCQIHGFFYQKPSIHLVCNGCPKCSRPKERLETRMTKEEFIEKAKQTHGDFYNYSLVEIGNKFEKVSIICPKHGVFEKEKSSHIFGSGCPLCKTSKFEQRVGTWLKDNNFNFISQKTFDGCRGVTGRKLMFDFYLPDYNVCIECDGDQHKSEKDYWFFSKNWVTKTKEESKEKFKKLKQRDKIKDDFCLKNNVYLIRIPYCKVSDVENQMTSMLIKHCKQLGYYKDKKIVI